MVRPFAGLRYAREDLSATLAPPYDIITAQDREQLLGRDPYNAVRIELSYAGSEEAGGPERYSEAAATLREWRQRGILRYDDGPCIYPCAHEFGLRGRRLTRLGVLCALRLSPFEDGVVLPHEGTLRGPRRDRRLLMLACQAQISPVFALHDDARGQAAEMIEEMMCGQPQAHAEVGDERHRLWRRYQDDLTRRYCELIGQGPIYIADGHHRYETALTVGRELRDTHPQAPAEAAFNYVLTLLCPAQQPAVVILPTHRLLRVQSRQQWQRLQAQVERHFERRELGCDAADPAAAGEVLARSLEQPTADMLFGMYTRAGGCALLSVNHRSLPADPGPGGYNELATVLIHRLLIDPVIGAERMAEQVAYVSDEAEAIERVAEGQYECALFLRPTTVAQVQRVAGAELRMPGKSTYFYPKAPTGLVINDISPERTVG